MEKIFLKGIVLLRLLFVRVTCVQLLVYIYIYTSSSLSSCHPARADLPDPLPLPFIAPGKSSRLHPVSVQSCYKYVLAGRPAFTRPCEGARRSTSLMSLSLLLLQCSACLVRLTLIVFVIGCKRSYICCFVGCCLLELFNIARSILV